MKFAIKYEPPIIALEYRIISKNLDYLLEVNLEDQIKKMKSIDEIISWIFYMYSDIINNKTVSEKQVIHYNEDFKSNS